MLPKRVYGERLPVTQIGEANLTPHYCDTLSVAMVTISCMHAHLCGTALSLRLLFS
jgi:hypothetical protein